MHEAKSSPKKNAIAMLKKDHQVVKGLFDRFEKAKETRVKKAIVEKALEALKIHATVEEELFYPALRQAMKDEDGLMDEADEEHHVAKVLIAELDIMSGSEEHYDAKFTVLAENVRHHIKEEEEDMFPKAAKTDVDFVALGVMMAQRKRELATRGVPPDAEMRMISKVGLRGDSPAMMAAKTLTLAFVPRLGEPREGRRAQL